MKKTGAKVKNSAPALKNKNEKSIILPDAKALQCVHILR